MSKTTQNRSQIPAESCHLYRIRSPQVLATRLGWPLDKLEALAKDGSYAVYPHPKTKRLIEEPGKLLQSLHRQLHRYLSRIQVPPYLHSAVKGRSYLSNAKAHVGSGGLIKIDIAKFYKSVPQHKVMHFFRDTLECAPDVAGLLANLICYDAHLATGSSVSPIISYFAFKAMFDALADLADRSDLTMTCYVDDVAISGDQVSVALLREARSIVFREGLKAHKDRYFRPESAKIVTGVAITQSGISLPHSRWAKINQEIRVLEETTDDRERLDKYPRLVSRLYEAAQIEPSCRKLADDYHKAWRTLKLSQAAVAASKTPGSSRRGLNSPRPNADA